ncbi:hypothetical protein SPONN_2353 [uncultured Candidatus Thioglobus sp.]|nr:hypothetical protein SPONL_1739 [uncultured Candidatus Thioglobus sp.]SMN01268.1 hypothetical protein SPONN_2353 [uncultured Candidatus Thioglobus sp.]
MRPCHLRTYRIVLLFVAGIHEWCVFQAILDLVEPDVHEGQKLSKFTRLLMFLMKVRLDLFDEDLACRFGVNVSTVSRNFHRMLNILDQKLAGLIIWPDRETLRQTMPSSFRKFFKACAVIIDCSEIFLERPSNLLARAQVWSNYKHHHTVKFLIGITPQGTISFVSDCYGGRASDKEIMENSNLINHLLPGKHKILTS